MIFVDSNIPMYLIGAPHVNKDAARSALERCITRGERIVTSVDVKEARDIMMGLAKKRLSARDALHAAVMRRRSIERVMSFDSGFDALGWVERIS